MVVKEMKLFRLILVALLSAIAVVPALAQFPTTWSAFQNMPLDTTGRPLQMVKAPGGGYLIYQNIYNSSVLTKVDDTGAELWSRGTIGANGDMAASGAGIATTGYADRASFNLASYNKTLTINRYSLQGSLIWSRTMAVPYNPTTGHVAMDAAGNVFVSDTDYNKSVVRKFSSATGSYLFNVTLPVNPIGTPALACDSQGNVYAALDVSVGIVQSSALCKYDATGAPLWSKVYPGRMPRLFVDSSDNAFLVCANNGSRVIKHDPNGNVLFDSNSAAPSEWYADVSSSGAVAIGANDDQLFSVSLFDSSGSFLWTKSATANGGAVCFDAAGNVYALSTGSNPSITKFDVSGNVVWKVTKGLKGIQRYNGRMFIDSAGRLVLLFQHSQENGTFSVSMQLYDANGSMVWGQPYSGHRTYDVAMGSATDAAGNTYVSGDAKYAGPSDRMFVTKFTAGGTMAWSRSLPFMPAQGSVSKPCVMPGGGIAVAEDCPPSPGLLYERFFVCRYDALGNLLWTYIEPGTYQDVKDIKAGTDGSVYLCIHVTQSIQGEVQNNLRVTKLNANGTLAWSVDHPGQLGSYEDLMKMVLDDSGGAYVSFSLLDSVNQINTPTLVKYSSSGTLAWAKSAPNATYSSGSFGVALDSTGNAYLVADFYYNVWLYKFDASGNSVGDGVQLPAFYQPDFYIDSHDNLFLGGWADKSSGPAIEKLNTDGVSQWTTYLPWSKADFVHMVPDNQGGAFISGSTRGPTSIQLVTFHVGSDGAVAWPASGGLFQNGALVVDRGVFDETFANVTSDSTGSVYLTSSAYSPANTYDIHVVKYTSMDSAFVSQFVGSSMAAGQTYQVAVTFKNQGFENWTNAGGYRMITLNSSTWGIGSVYLGNGETIEPGQSKTFYFYVTAPAAPGVYNLQTKMYRNGFGSFGVQANTPNVTVTVRANAARNVSMIAPASVKAGSTFQVSVDMLNVGTNTWTLGGGYVLAPTTGFPIWNAASMPLLPADSIVKGAHKVFAFNCTAPASPGSYKMSWQMKAGPTYFGDQSIAKTITVTP